MASFCKVILDDDLSTCKLRIPPQFVIDYGAIIFRESSSKMMRLRIDDDESGKMWRVRVERIGGKLELFLTKGWTKFAKDVNLQSRAFVTFKLVDESALIFDVSVYDTTGCCITNYSYDDKEDEEAELNGGSNAERRWTFSQQLKKHHFKHARMLIPKALAVGTGIWKEGEIKLWDDKGREWAVKVSVWSSGTYCMCSSGWTDFLVANNAVIGNIVSFDFIVGGSVRAHLSGKTSFKLSNRPAARPR